MKIITFALKKGGNSKSTSSIISGLMLARHGRTLLIDCDSQNAATSFFFSDIDSILDKTIMEAVKGDVPFNDCIHPVISGLDMIPAKTEFSEINYWARAGKELLLKRKLKGAPYDYVVVDTGPYDNTETALGLAAANVIVIPVRLESMDVRAIGFTLAKIEEIKEINPDLEAVYILPTQKIYQNRTVQDLHLAALRDKFPGKVLNFEISFSSKISQFHVLKLDGLSMLDEFTDYAKLVEVIK
jgi:chromosome partitioning protein